jgi:hypothetical protein
MRQLSKRFAIVFSALFLALSPPVLAQADKFDGRPAFADGIDLSYYIWREGDKWLVRWTTKGQNRKFTGSVVTRTLPRSPLFICDLSLWLF